MNDIIRNSSFRIIARLDIKNEYIVKGINFEGIRKVGNPKILAQKYYNEGIDEIVYMDVVASLYERNTINNFIKEAARNIFVPLTVGGGIRTLQDIRNVLNCGADKVAINTAAIKNPNFIKEASKEIGSQSIIVSIEAKKIKNLKWEAYYDNGREKSGKDVIEWAIESEKNGAGELLVTSIDNDGVKRGMDLELIKKISESVTIPIIFAGGVGKIEHIKEVLPYSNAIAIASVLHYNEISVQSIKKSFMK